MIIRKQFKYEMGHIVRKAWSRRCSHNAHGHSYLVEFIFHSNQLDDGQMACDFGYIKQYFGPFVDSFDHSFWLWDLKEDEHIKTFFLDNFERVIVSPFSTTAEMQAKLFFVFGVKMLNLLVNDMVIYNDSIAPTMHSVRVHETATGYAEYSDVSLRDGIDINLKDVYFTDGIKDDWPWLFDKFYNKLIV